MATKNDELALKNELNRLKAMLSHHTAKLSRMRENGMGRGMIHRGYEEEIRHDYQRKYMFLLHDLARNSSQILDQANISGIDSIDLQLTLAEFEYELKLFEFNLKEKY